MDVKLYVWVKIIVKDYTWRMRQELTLRRLYDYVHEYEAVHGRVCAYVPMRRCWVRKSAWQHRKEDKNYAKETWNVDPIPSKITKPQPKYFICTQFPSFGSCLLVCLFDRLLACLLAWMFENESK